MAIIDQQNLYGTASSPMATSPRQDNQQQQNPQNAYVSNIFWQSGNPNTAGPQVQLNNGKTYKWSDVGKAAGWDQMVDMYGSNAMGIGGSQGTQMESLKQRMPIGTAIDITKLPDYKAPDQPISPQQPVTPVAPSTYSNPQYIQEQIAQYLGYGGDFGAGGAVTWYQQNPDKLALAKNIEKSLSTYTDSTNRMVPSGILENIASQYGYGGGVTPDPYESFLDQLNTMLQEFGGKLSGPSGVMDQNTRTYAAPEPKLTNDLDYLRGMSEAQQRANIASNALYGRGTPDDALKYYLDLLQADVIGADGQAGAMPNLMPIETQYLQSLGLNYGSGSDFLDSVMRYYGQV